MKPIMSPYQIMFETLCEPVIACYELMAEYGKMQKQYLPHIHRTFNVNNTTGEDIKIRGWFPVCPDCHQIDKMAITKQNYVSDIVIKVRVGKLSNMVGSLATTIGSIEEVKKQTKPGLYVIEGTDEFHVVAFAEQTMDEFLKVFNFKFNLPSQYKFERKFEDAKINIDCEIVRGVLNVHWIKLPETTYEEALDYIEQGGYLGMFPEDEALEYPAEGELIVKPVEDKPAEPEVSNDGENLEAEPPANESEPEAVVEPVVQAKQSKRK